MEYQKCSKEEAIKLALSSGQPFAQTASEFVITKSTFYGWVKDHMNNKKDRTFSKTSKASSQTMLYYLLGG